MGFLPKSCTLFDLYDKQIEQVIIGVKIFCSLDLSSKEKAAEMKRVEDATDAVVHDIYDILDGHRDLPLESHENFESLAHDIDNVLDLLEKASDRIMRFGLVYEPVFIHLGEMSLEAVYEIQKGLAVLRKISNRKGYKELKEIYIRINDIESKGDEIHRAYVSEVACVDDSFSRLTARDFWFRERRMEIAAYLERALDEAENVANTFESLKKKNP